MNVVFAGPMNISVSYYVRIFTVGINIADVHVNSEW